MEFPAVGYRLNSAGSLYSAGTWGYYWSSVINGSNGAYYLSFNGSDLNVGDSGKRVGHSVRCVR
ncbi:MAG: fibrobacter succinogenes major paralogous domain-containing protein [Rikenellaceae bacterium]|nr:fibrobacter succinogenes major paralogous domain-containing protein [Rikenellaceae bacterium]